MLNGKEEKKATNEERFDEAYEYVMDLLSRKLSANLTYHDKQHTLEVIKAAIEISKAENLPDEEMFLVKTAALYHDVGFVTTYNDHEEASCKIAIETLPAFGYSEIQTEQICKIIMATKLPSNPTTKLEEIICDADLFYLGTDSFPVRSEKLFTELLNEKKVNNRREWDKVQTSFLQTHRYFTKYAKDKLNNTKSYNYKKVMEEKRRIIKSTGRIGFKNRFGDYFLIALGVVSAGFALKGFLVPNKFFDGGITGISLLLHELYHINLALTIVAVNMPLIIASYFTVSKNFAIKTFVTVLCLGLCLLYVPYPIITSDKLLISIFGGFFAGLGIGFCMRAGSALDGVEILALYTIKKTSFTITEIILAINILIFFFAAFRFGIETALYSVLTYFTASRTIDYVVEGIEAYTGVTIISGESETIKYRLVNELGKGITVYKGERGFLPNHFEVSSDCDIIFTVVTRLELRRLKNLIYHSDPKAFVFANTIKEASGGIIKKLHKH